MGLCYGIRGSQACHVNHPARMDTSHRPSDPFQTHPYMLNKTVLIVFSLLFVLMPPLASAAMYPPNESIRYPASLSEGIDFSRPGYPDFIANVSGLSAYEKTYRWTDANAGPSARFRFKEPLPKRFVLEIQAEAFGPNGSYPTIVKLGQQTATIQFLVRDVKPHYIELTNPDGADTLEFTPPKPISPLAFDGSSGDTRKLGIAFKRLAIRSPMEIAIIRFVKDAQSLIEFWSHRAHEVIKNLHFERLKILVYDSVIRSLRWFGW